MLVRRCCAQQLRRCSTSTASGSATAQPLVVPFRIKRSQIEDIVHKWYERVSPLRNARVTDVRSVFLPISLVSSRAETRSRAWVYGAIASDVSPWLVWSTGLADAVPLKELESAEQAPDADADIDDEEPDAELLSFEDESRAVDHLNAVAPVNLFPGLKNGKADDDTGPVRSSEAVIQQYLFPFYSVTFTILGVPRQLLVHGATGRCAALPDSGAVLSATSLASSAAQGRRSRLPSLSGKEAIDDALPARHHFGMALDHARPAVWLERLGWAAAAGLGPLVKFVLSEVFILMPLRGRMAFRAQWRALMAAAAYRVSLLRHESQAGTAQGSSSVTAADTAHASACSSDAAQALRHQAALARAAMLQGMQILWQSPELTPQLLQQRRGNPNGLSPGEASALMQVINNSGLAPALHAGSVKLDGGNSGGAAADPSAGSSASGDSSRGSDPVGAAGLHVAIKDAMLEIHRSPEAFRLALNYDATDASKGSSSGGSSGSGFASASPSGWHMLSVAPGAASFSQAYAARSPLSRNVTVIVEAPQCPIPAGPPFGGAAPSPSSVGTRLFSGRIASAPVTSAKAQKKAAAGGSSKKDEER